ncbi:MAG TPA: ferritin-like domain-containing protein [Pirellulales bacterium]|jgi:ferritin-like metal-binding protein YciE
MSWFSKMLGTEMTLDNLDKLLEEQLQDLHSAETQLISALPKMADAAHSSTLKNAFRSHLVETKQHKVRVERALKMLGKKVKSKTCDAMKGLISEGSEVIELEGDADVKDAALIAAAQRVEHYEIAGYGCVRAFAQRLNRSDVAKLLEQTLKEEGAADKKLTAIAEKSINAHAAAAKRKSTRVAAPHQNGRSTGNGRMVHGNGRSTTSAGRPLPIRAQSSKKIAGSKTRSRRKMARV